MTTEPIRAAGAVVWRGDEVALVHRPKYDDWTFPKGKLKPGEHVIAAALREVREETGLTVHLGRALPAVHYLRKGRLKRVDYWIAHVVSGAFVPGPEVDDLVWLTRDAARARLTYEWDASLLTAPPPRTTPLLLVRHGSAGSRDEWEGDDDLRPLDADGLAQARTLATVLPAYRPAALLSSPSKRCVQTLPGAGLRLDPLLSEQGYDQAKSAELVRGLEGPAAVCSHGKVLPPLIDELSGLRMHLRKGAFAVLHRLDGEILHIERYSI
ncbi:NUDIX hydrolase [Nonomuraea africana]|uniref:8-oxo-dGTP diphosphatase n=1 Tax=Nonomuraea africana TaxID=46171 RepID=A0ABR9KPI2_9ACTN|nr:NUDIX hydrolase [Nonomuraea africana]MBE1563518.1 8-oxo-dGTP diphosphatase [Nonomuraea africana]